MLARLIVLASFAAASSCLAQLGDKTLSQRLNSVMVEGLPKDQVNPMNYKKFEGNGTLKVNETFRAKDFQTKDFEGKNFSTRSFLGIKNPWFGNKVYETSANDLWTKSAMPNKDGTFSTKTASTKAFAQDGKSAALGSQSVEVKPFTERGKSQGALDLEQKNLTIDDVREILNKNR